MSRSLEYPDILILAGSILFIACGVKFWIVQRQRHQPWWTRFLPAAVIGFGILGGLEEIEFLLDRKQSTHFLGYYAGILLIVSGIYWGFVEHHQPLWRWFWAIVFIGLGIMLLVTLR